MKRTWLTAVVPITLALTSLLLSVPAAGEHRCFGQAVPAGEADDDLRVSDTESTVSYCDTTRIAKHISQLAFDRSDSVGPVFSFPVAPERSISDFTGLASQHVVPRAEVGKVKPSIRGKPP